MTDITQRKRITTATERKSATIRHLIGLFKNGPMCISKISASLTVAASTARTYIYDLRDAGVIEVVDIDISVHANLGFPIFGLVQNTVHVDKFLAAIAANPGKPLQAPKKKYPHDPSRHFHIMSDDENYYVRPSTIAPKHDDLFNHFFGMAPCTS